jgi:hypothetical protein
MHAAKKYQVRKEARMEFKIEDAEGEGESSVGVASVSANHGSLLSAP